MWPLAVPQHSVDDSIAACTNRLNRGDLRQRVHEAQGGINACSQQFQAAAENGVVHALAEGDFEVSGVESHEMGWLYKNRMVRTVRGKVIYDDLMAAPEHSRCPLCGQRVVSTLDHHLPKADYPALAIDPINLIPVCKDCNHQKSTLTAASPEEEFLHPYFDNINDETWLSARVARGRPASLVFSVHAPVSWSTLLTNRATNHFNRFRLAALYSKHAGQELSAVTPYLGDLLQRSGSDALKAHLTDTAISRAGVEKNTWQGAMYLALAADQWFYTGGFL